MYYPPPRAVQQLRVSLRGPVLPRTGGGLYRSCVSPHNVHVLHVRRTGCNNADYVVNWECKSDYIGVVIIRGPLDQYRQLCAVEVVHGLVQCLVGFCL